jgi:thiamine biosynthesis lipoprotein
VRRARPWLGTVVEIRAGGRSTDEAEQAINSAFSAVARVHRLMNIHDSTSELRQVMAAACGRAHPVHPWTRRVLSAALRLARLSDGAFDFTLCGRWRDLEILSDNRVRLRRPIALDLSGIAKGFAVDVAIAELRRTGMKSGAVNAGGDLRVFGPVREPLLVRCPDEPGRCMTVGFLANEAAATSGNYFDSSRRGRLRNPYDGRTALPRGSVTVCAASCLLADGLTKVVAVLGVERAKSLLAAHGAAALVLPLAGDVQTWEPTAHAA